jgi:hypothetical protein
LFNKIKALAKDRRVQLIVGAALVGIAITCPPAAVLTGGLVQGFLPYSLAPLAKGLTAAGGGFLMRGFLKERNKKKEGNAPEMVPPTPEPGPKPTPETTPKPTPETTPGTTPETKPTPGGATPETTPGTTPETQSAPSETKPTPGGATPETTPGTTPGATPETQPGETENYDLGEDLPDHLAGRFGNIKELNRVDGDPDQLAGRFGNVEELIRKKQEFEEQKKAEEEIATEMSNNPEIPTPEEIETKSNEFEERRQIEEEIATEMPNSPEIPTPEEADDKFKKIKEVEEDEEERTKEMHD